MLILSRKPQEAVILSGNIEVKIAKIEGDSVKLAIRAPKEVSIVRKEVMESVERANREASSLVNTKNVSELVKSLKVK